MATISQDLSRSAPESSFDKSHLLPSFGAGNGLRVVYPGFCSVQQLFEAQVDRTPEAVAVIFGKQTLCYRELNGRANQVAHYLRQRGVGPEVLVGLAVDRSLEMVVGLLGILKAGGAYVPLDPGYPKERLAFLMEDSQRPFLLTQQRLLGTLPAHQAQVVCLDNDWSLISGGSTANPVGLVSAENLAYVIYTSGSTGKPKGVQIRHGAVVNLLCSMAHRPGLSSDDTLLAVTTLAFDISVLELFLPLCVGGRVVVATREIARDGRKLLSLLAASGTTVMQATPATWQLLIAAGWNDPMNLKVLCGGEALTRDLADALLARSASVWNMYGPTETTVWSATALVEPGQGPVPIGPPIANTEFCVLDEQGQPVPVGCEGELHIGGAGLARGYLNRPGLTAERFIPHPLSETPGARLYKTGDLVRRLPDENLEFLGRLDHQVKLNGFRIELGEIEAALIQHPQVREAVVLLREDRPANKRIAAYVVPKERPGPMPGDLRRFLSTRLPAYMVPSAFLVLEGLPLTPNNKVDRRALPVPETEQDPTCVAPRTPLEESLARIWKGLLGVNSVGIHDDFFELGGDSLLAVELFARIEKAFGLRLPLSTLFQEATIERLADRLTQPQPGTVRPALVELQKGGTKPPLFLVHSLGGSAIIYSQLVRCLGPDQPAYGFQQLASGEDVHKTHASVEAMAAAYVEELLAVQPKEPFLLLGHSFGAIVALEMAQQLTAKGHHVAMLAITDENLPDPEGKVSWNASQIWGVVQELPYWLRYDFLRRTPSDHYARFRRLVRRAKRKIAKVLGRLTAKSRDEEIAELFTVYALPNRIRAFSAANFRIFVDYRPRTYPGTVIVFRARSHLLGPQKKDLGWGRIAAGGVTVRIIPGTHDSILTHPHVKILARELEAVLSRL